MQNIIFHFYYFGKSFWNVNNKKLSSFAQLTKKLPGIGCWGKENKLSMEFFKNLSKMLSRIHRHKYLWYYLFFVFFIGLFAWGKLYSGTPVVLNIKVSWQIPQNQFMFWMNSNQEWKTLCLVLTNLRNWSNFPDMTVVVNNIIFIVKFSQCKQNDLYEWDELSTNQPDIHQSHIGGWW